MALVPIGFAIGFFAAVVYNVAQISYPQAICPPRLMGRMNAAVRWIVWGTMPLGALIGGALGTAIGVRPTLWIGADRQLGGPLLGLLLPAAADARCPAAARARADRRPRLTARSGRRR